MRNNKRKYVSPNKTTNKTYPKKTHSKHYRKSKSKSKSKENINETSSSNKNMEQKEITTEIFNMKDITEKLGNSKIFCRDDEKKEILEFIKSKEKNKKTLFVSGQPGTGKTSLIAEILNCDLMDDQKYFLKFSINAYQLIQQMTFMMLYLNILMMQKFIIILIKYLMIKNKKI